MKQLLSKLFILSNLMLVTSCKGIDTYDKNAYFYYDNVNYTTTIGSKINNENIEYGTIKINKFDKPLRKDFAYGVDVSSIIQVEECGGVFYNKEGKQQDVFEILKDSGVNTIRLRQFNNPYDENGRSYGAGHNDLTTNINIAKRAKRVGMNIMIDFHYSDFWADPAHQMLPKSWKNIKDLNDVIYTYTKQSLDAYKKLGIRIDSVQIGNEIHNGMCWPSGKLDYSNYDVSMKKISGMLNSGIKAVKESDDNIKTIIHLANANDKDGFNRFLKALNTNEVPYDIIGISYYPIWHGEVSKTLANLNNACKKYNKKGMVVETSYAFTLQTAKYSHNSFGPEQAKKCKYDVSYQGQCDLIREICRELSNFSSENGIGCFYWEPATLPLKDFWAGTKEGLKYHGYDGKGWQCSTANQNLFSFKGRLLPSGEIYNLIKNSF